MKTKHNVGKGQQQAVDAIEQIEAMETEQKGRARRALCQEEPGDEEVLDKKSLDEGAVPPGVGRATVPQGAERLPYLMKLLLLPELEGVPRLPLRQIAATTGYSKTKVLRIRDTVRAASETSADFLVMGAKALHRKLFPAATSRREEPDFATVERRLKEPGQTLRRLWREYRQPLGCKALGYEQFTRRFKRYRGGRKLAMRQKHLPGMEVCVDFSGKKPWIYDEVTGEKIEVNLFVGSMRLSLRSFAWVVLTQSTEDWLDCGKRMLEFFGGVPRMHLCDNLKAGVTESGRVPKVQEDYLRFAEHYRTAIWATRPAKAPDKATVELEIQHVQRHLLPELAKQKFYSLEAMNAEITRLMVEYNNKPFSERPGSRESQFLSEDKPALMPLPKEPFVHFKRHARRKVPRDYHVLVDGHHYSVPYRCVDRQAEARVSIDRVQIWIEGECVAEHPRGKAGGCTTNPDHQTDAHRAQSLRTVTQVNGWAQRVGPNMVQLMAAQFKRHKVPLQGLQAAFALQNLGRRATFAELEAAAGEALTLGTLTPSDTKRLLQDGAKRPQTPVKQVAPTLPEQPLSLPKRSRRQSSPAPAKRAAVHRVVNP